MASKYYAQAQVSIKYGQWSFVALVLLYFAT